MTACFIVIICFIAIFFAGYALVSKMDCRPQDDPKSDAFYDDRFPKRKSRK